MAPGRYLRVSAGASIYTRVSIADPGSDPKTVESEKLNENKGKTLSVLTIEPP